MLVTVAVYWPATGHDFVNYDDPDYVTANPHVQGGLNWEGVKWAFLNPVSSNWHPLTVLSHMLDCQMFGLNPWGHHLTSVLFHALNAMLVFVLLQQMTGARWRSLFVATLFAVHPLRVESVAWVAERKDVLSAFFGLLALMSYARYAQKEGRSNQLSVISHQPDGSRITDHRSLITDYCSPFYLLSLFFFACGLMSKPMLVTWPFVMLLLDYWPLKRSAERRVRSAESGESRWAVWRRLLLEKLPFFALAAGASVVTFVEQGSAMTAAKNLSFGMRGGNALISYCRYMGKLFWPTDLAVFYPHPGYWPLGKVLMAGVLILGISGLSLWWRRRAPFLLMGWLWYCGTLVPVIGLVQVGGHALADRYSYLPSLGLLILGVWGAYELTRRWQPAVIGLSVGGAASIVLGMAWTRCQLGQWKDSEALFRHALEVTEDNSLAHKALGDALDKKGLTDEAISHYREAIRLKLDYADAHNNLGNDLNRIGKTGEAISQLQEAIRLKPDLPEALNNLAWILATDPDVRFRNGAEAVRLASRACECTAWKQIQLVGTLAAAYAEAGQFDEAVVTAQKACNLAGSLGQTNLLERNQQLLRLYQHRQPCREPPSR